MKYVYMVSKYEIINGVRKELKRKYFTTHRYATDVFNIIEDNYSCENIKVITNEDDDYKNNFNHKLYNVVPDNTVSFIYIKNSNNEDGYMYTLEYTPANIIEIF